MKKHPLLLSILTAGLIAGTVLSFGVPAQASDHRDGPTNAYDGATDIGDVYFFKDPVDATKAVIIGTTHGFIVPGEQVNEALFDPVVRYRFEIYNKHVNVARPPNPLDADSNAVKAMKNRAIAKYVASVKPDKFIDVTFSPRTAGPGPVGKEALQIPAAQVAHVQLTGFDGIATRTIFDAAVLNPNLAGTAPLQSTGVTSLDTAVPGAGAAGISVFCGESDDPFFFDIPAFSAFVASIRGGAPNVSVFDRARDTFAGYSTMTIAIQVPISLLTSVKVGRTFSSAGPIVGVNLVAQRHAIQKPTTAGDVVGLGAYKTIDRAGNPGVNALLVPLTRKNSYNVGTPKDDANLKFALPSVATRRVVSMPGILATLANFGTTGGPFDGFGVSSQGTLAALAVLQGDLLKLDTTLPASSGFPNGRRLQDDVVDTLLNVVTNGVLTTGDKVNANDVAFELAFPYVGLTNQPLPNAGVDNTQN